MKIDPVPIYDACVQWNRGFRGPCAWLESNGDGVGFKIGLLTMVARTIGTNAYSFCIRLDDDVHPYYVRKDAYGRIEWWWAGDVDDNSPVIPTEDEYIEMRIAL
jgi:hypothetical protein